MFLKSLEIQGFKSFPDKTRLQFGRGMTAVVGPNGSGKSNISDAVRWVLGEQSTKALRGAKMEDVIFNGTATRRGHGFAEVRLALDNSGRELAVEADEVVVSRKYYRTGESEYRINDKSVRLKDVNELFMDTGLGRDGYSLIGQGKIAEIVGAKSSQRREIFEEAAGISKFRYRKEEAERHLQMAQENLLRLRDNLNALEERVGPLREQSEKARLFLNYSDEKKSVEISVWMRTLKRVKAQLQEQSGGIDLCQAEYNGLDTEYTEAEERINRLYEQVRDVDSTVEELRAAISRDEAAAAEAASRAAVFSNDIRHNESESARLDTEIQELASSGGEVEQALAAHLAEKALHEHEAEQLAAKAAVLSTEGEKISAEEQKQAEAAAEIDARLSQSAAELANLNVLSATSASELEQYSQRLEQLLLSRDQKQALFDSYKSRLSECSELLEAIEEKIESLTNSKSGIEMKRNLRQQQLASLEERRGKIIREGEAALQKARLLQELEQNMEGFAQSVRFVLERARAGALRGILEPVSKVISVDSKYSLAVETAAAGALQNVVVSDEEAAKRAISMLKEQNRGRVTFLPLTSIKGSRLNENGLDACPGFIGLACDLVGFEPKYEGIIRSILGRIAVAEDLNSAISIAKKYSYRFRIVTLDGQLVNAGGSLTGGSSVKSAGLLSRRQEIEELQAKAEALKKSLSATDADYNRLREELSSLAAEALGAQGELATASEDKIRAESEKKHLLAQISDAEAADEEALAQREKLKKMIDEATSRREGQQTCIAKIETLRAQLIDGQNSLQSQTSALLARRAENSEAAAALKLSAAIAQKDIEAAALAVFQLTESQTGRQGRIEALRETIAALCAENASLTSRIEQTEASRLALSENVRAAQEKISALFAQRQSFELSTTKERAAQKTIVARREEASVKLARARARIEDLQKDYDRIIGQLWDEYEYTYSMAEELATEIQEPQKANRLLAELRAKIKALGSVNLSAIEEYKEVSGRYEFLKDQIEDVEKSNNELFRLIHGLTGQMRTIFSDRFTQIAGNFAVVFKELFGGGEAQLTLTDPDNVLESGIDIDVQPPGKIITNLASLSGGEQAFVAIAIYFAILKVSPAPFCILDEIEAALDEANVDKYAEYLLRLSSATQFIAITHRRGTMEHADSLYGVTMQEEGVSKLLLLSLSDAEKVVQK